MSEEACAAALREWSESTSRELTAENYEDWRTYHEDGYPDADEIRERLGDGSWIRAISTVLGDGVYREQRTSRTYSYETVVNSLTLAISETDGGLSKADYAAWREENPDHPSYRAVYNHLGDGQWSTAIEAVGGEANMYDAGEDTAAVARFREYGDWLTPAQREDFKRTAIDGLSHDERAKERGVATDSVSSSIQRAKNRLREVAADRGDPAEETDDE